MINQPVTIAADKIRNGGRYSKAKWQEHQGEETWEVREILGAERRIRDAENKSQCGPSGRRTWEA